MRLKIPLDFDRRNSKFLLQRHRLYLPLISRAASLNWNLADCHWDKILDWIARILQEVKAHINCGLDEAVVGFACDFLNSILRAAHLIPHSCRQNLLSS